MTTNNTEEGRNAAGVESFCEECGGIVWANIEKATHDSGMRLEVRTCKNCGAEEQHLLGPTTLARPEWETVRSVNAEGVGERLQILRSHGIPVRADEREESN